MLRSAEQLRTDALAIWRAGVDAVRSDRLVRDYVQVKGSWLRIGEDLLELRDIRRLVVFGAGKAGAGMAAGLEEAIGPEVAAAKQLTGWINVPAGCVRPLNHIHLHAARPAGINEPTAAGVEGATRILQLAESLGPNDVAICLLSGGGSALLPAPVAGVSLEDKQQLTRFLSAAGANIAELNAVRKRLSRIKGGGLARACRAGQLYTLILSDVLGDPLDVIASGPTTPDTASLAEVAAVLERFRVREANVAPSAIRYLDRLIATRPAAEPFPTEHVFNAVLGNNATAVDGAGIEAERRGYSHAMLAARELEGSAEDVARKHAEMALRMRSESGPDCLITGGEPTVTLAPPDIRGRGGRNQHLVLAAANALGLERWHGLCILSGGTDGEDGPTDAAGAFCDAGIAAAARASGLQAEDFLRRTDSYSFFEQVGGLIRTGPTHTNVCDVRVVVVDRIAGPHG